MLMGKKQPGLQYLQYLTKHSQELGGLINCTIVATDTNSANHAHALRPCYTVQFFLQLAMQFYS
jgi:hypothetical protein